MNEKIWAILLDLTFIVAQVLNGGADMKNFGHEKVHPFLPLQPLLESCLLEGVAKRAQSPKKRTWEGDVMIG